MRTVTTVRRVYRYVNLQSGLRIPYWTNDVLVDGVVVVRGVGEAMLEEVVRRVLVSSQPVAK